MLLIFREGQMLPLPYVLDPTHLPTHILLTFKVFAELAIKFVPEKDSVAIISFSDEAEIEFPMTKMTDASKRNAREVIKRLSPRENTNLEAGLMAGLDSLKSTPTEKSIDRIILFTDGETNTGQEDVKVIVKKFKAAEKQLNKNHVVSLSALSMGEYRPVLLSQLADMLGSEAFYWLSEEEDFEYDMLLPVLLHDATCVTNVSVELTCLSNFTFEVDSLLLKDLRKSSLTTIEYFIHSIPGGINKHFPLTIIPPEGNLETFHGQPFINVKVTYRDTFSRELELFETIIFSSENLKTCRTKGRTERGVLYSKASEGVSAYRVEQNRLDLSWMGAQEALLNIVREDCRMLTLRELDNTQLLILEDESEMQLDSFDEALQAMEEIKTSYKGIFGHRNKFTNAIDACVEEWKDHLKFGKSIANPYNYGRIASLHSSIATEMPVPKGVYKDSLHHQFMPRQVRKKMKKYEKVVKKENKVKYVSDDTGVFRSKTILLSESLRTKTFGSKNETMADMIARLGGRPEYYVIVSPYKTYPKWYEAKVFRNTVLVSSIKDHENDSLTVRAARKAHIPVVQEQFVLDCARRKKFLKIEGYFYNGTMT